MRGNADSTLMRSDALRVSGRKASSLVAGLRRAAPYGVGALSLLANALFVWPLIGRLASPALTGEISAGLATIGMAAPLTTVGIHILVMRDSAEPDLHHRREARSAVGAAMWVGVPLALALFALGLALSPDAGVLAFCSVSGGLSLIVISMARGLARPGVFMVQAIAAQTLALVIGAVAAIATHRAFPGFAAIGVSTALTSILGAHRLGCLGLAPAGLVALRRAIRSAMPLVPHLVLTVATIQGVRLAVAVTQGFEAAAHAQFALLLGGLPITGVITLNGYWSVEALRQPIGESFDQVCRSYGAKLVGSAFALALCTLGVMRLGLDSWLPPGYPIDDVATAVALMLPAAVFQALADAQSTRAMKADRLGILSTATAAGALATFVVVVTFADALGIAAAGIGVSAGSILRYVVGAAALSARSIPQGLPWSALALGGLSAGGWAVGVVMLWAGVS